MNSTATLKFVQRRESLMDVAVDLFRERGVEGATLNDLATAVGLNTKSVRYYFKLKDDLIGECLLRAMSHHAAILKAASREPTAETRLLAYGRGFFEWMRQIETGERPSVPGFGLMRGIDSLSVHAAYHDMRAAIGELAATAPQGSIARRACEHYLQSQFLGVITWSQRHRPDQLGRAADRFIDIVSTGIAAESNAWTPPTRLPADFVSKRAEDRLEAFLRVATRQINNQGYRGASIEKIAAELNYTKGALYHHIETKNDLIVRCFERTCQVMARAQDFAVQTGGSGLQQIINAVAFIIRYQLAVEGRLLQTGVLGAVSGDLAQDLTLKLDRITANFADMVSDGMLDGSIRTVDPRITAEMVSGVANAGEELWYWFPKVSAENKVILALNPLIRGVLG